MARGQNNSCTYILDSFVDCEPNIVDLVASVSRLLLIGHPATVQLVAMIVPASLLFTSFAIKIRKGRHGFLLLSTYDRSSSVRLLNSHKLGKISSLTKGFFYQGEGMEATAVPSSLLLPSDRIRCQKLQDSRNPRKRSKRHKPQSTPVNFFVKRC